MTADETPFSCPVCGEPLALAPGGLRCASGHHLDRARQGYVNLLRKAPDTVYGDAGLFIARRAVYRAGFFDPLLAAVRSRMRAGLVLDAGCGEGSALAALAEGPDAVGMDIERAAVRMAAGAFKGCWWCVGDLCAIPMATARADTLLNILTPANYAEFLRVLRPGGRLLKVVPGERHLAEIRAVTNQRAQGDAEETTALFAKRFRLLETLPVRYTVPCDAALAAQVFRMTPLTAGHAAAVLPAMPITVDVTLLVGERAYSQPT